MTKVAICIPHLADYYYAEFVHSLLMMSRPVETAFFILGTKPLDTCRNQIAAQALRDEEVTHLLWMDSDMSFRHAGDALMRLMGHNQPFVSALYFSKQFPFTPHAYRADSRGTYSAVTDYPDGLFKADGVGMGFALIRREVFEKVKPPWFHFDTEKGIGEDLNFSKKAREHYEIYVDGGLKLFHLRAESFGEGHFKLARQVVESEKEKHRAARKE